MQESAERMQDSAGDGPGIKRIGTFCVSGTPAFGHGILHSISVGRPLLHSAPLDERGVRAGPAH